MHTHTHTQATVLEEMPPFPERESSLLSKLYQTAPWTAKLHQNESTESTTATVTVPTQDEPQVGSLLNGPVTTQIAESAPVTDSLISTSPAGMCMCVCVCMEKISILCSCSSAPLKHTGC